MEYLYRVLNDFDVKINPLENGLINKKIIDDSFWHVYQFAFYFNSDIYKICNPYSLSKEENKLLYEKVKKYYGFGAIPFIKDRAIKHQQGINIILDGIRSNNQKVRQLYLNKLLEIFKTAENHVRQGSKYNYMWISLSKEINALKKYYLNQQKHSIAVIKSEINGILDTDGNLLVCDLSDDCHINNYDFLLNMNRNKTINYQRLLSRINKPSFNFARASKEVLYYNYIPKEKVIAVLHPLEIELLLNGLLNFEVYEKSLFCVEAFYRDLLDILRN